MTDTPLMAEFPGVDTAEWERVIREDLKGADSPRSLVWRAEEGLDIKPYYRAEDLDHVVHLKTRPEALSCVRGSQKAGWHILERIDAESPAEANRVACKAVSDGAEAILFSNLRIANASDLAVALVHLDEIPVCFEDADRPLIRLLLERPGHRDDAAVISTGFNPLDDPDFAAAVLANRIGGFVPLSISATEFHEQGATSAEEIGLALAAGAEFFDSMMERGIGIDQLAGSLTFSFATGPGFFLQIAKLRALRVLWAQAVESFGGQSRIWRARIHARTARWNQAIYDPHVNILRATTEAMSAVLGGADSIEVAAFNACYSSGDEMSRRLARNTQLILKQEADLARVADPGGGSYCLEVLTDAIARSAWELLQKIESEGGYRSACEKGVVDLLLCRRRDQRARSVVSRKLVLTGTNRFADASESAMSRIGSGDALHSGRAAEPFEELRLRTERHGARGSQKPRILLAEMGEDRKSQSARSNFAMEFLACAGLESRIMRFRRAEEIKTGDWDLIVLCSADAEYLSIASTLFERMTASVPVVVAGLPETADKLRALGVAEFMHVRCNAVETLANIQRLAGIKD
ncbi:MAG TPA: methylmalonyl-CoA mutase family protein [Terracidiphilus sp.]|nr:methylmalonyl-CoA mutase family protein [Terracidiphilus sp.]